MSEISSRSEGRQTSEQDNSELIHVLSLPWEIEFAHDTMRPKSAGNGKSTLEPAVWHILKRTGTRRAQQQRRPNSLAPVQRTVLSGRL